MEESKEKITIIGEIIRRKEEVYIATKTCEPKDEWYGEQFDTLYEKDIKHLKILLLAKKNS